MTCKNDPSYVWPECVPPTTTAPIPTTTAPIPTTTVLIPTTTIPAPTTVLSPTTTTIVVEVGPPATVIPEARPVPVATSVGVPTTPAVFLPETGSDPFTVVIAFLAACAMSLGIALRRAGRR
jgi:hypothetical protein